MYRLRVKSNLTQESIVRLGLGLEADLQKARKGKGPKG